MLQQNGLARTIAQGSLSGKSCHRQPVGWVEPTGPARSGRPDDRLRETHHLQLWSRGENYRRNFICGGSFFFTVDLAERRLRLLVDHIDAADNRSPFRER
jgi:hypothetical protein